MNAWETQRRGQSAGSRVVCSFPTMNTNPVKKDDRFLVTELLSVEVMMKRESLCFVSVSVPIQRQTYFVVAVYFYLATLPCK